MPLKEGPLKEGQGQEHILISLTGEIKELKHHL